MLSPHTIVPNVDKIAVIRVNALGDFIFTLPALEALRAAYPGAEIVLLAKSWHADFLAHRRSPVDRVVIVPPYVGVGEEEGSAEDPAELEAFFSRMQQEHFDLALQLHGGGRYSNPFTRRLGARLTAGLCVPDAVPLDRCLPYVSLQPEIMRYLEAVSLVGAQPTVLEPHIIVTQNDLAEALRIVPETHKPLVVLHPGASDAGRCWPPEKFAMVGDTLAGAGAEIVVTGTRDEHAIVAAVVNGMHSEAHDLSGRLSLGGLTGLLSRCRVVVSNDTGPLHLASAVGAATVGIYWCFNVITSSELTRARHRLVVSWQHTCPICGTDRIQSRCPHQPSFVSNISADEVIALALELFA